MAKLTNHSYLKIVLKSGRFSGFCCQQSSINDAMDGGQKAGNKGLSPLNTFSDI